ncbi:hypothetical protein OIU85_000768 [Salix viminalis]|uniref:Uncharacterized protein n=1 Tax=Salix viminalis TaxID=40686 RepID=A0A9Q0ZX95_SALVM|nr:hypothetical protein OIU85_000768 [Salix viminalis]
MAIFIQTNVLRHSLYLPKVSQPCCQNSAPLHVLPLPCVNGSSMKYLKYPPNCLIHQQFAPILKHRRSEPVVNYWNGSAVFLLDGKDKSEKDNQVTGFTFKLLLSVRDCLHIVVSDVSEILIM